MSRNLAIVGATGAVGRIVREILEQRNLELDSIRFVATPRSAGQQIQFRGETYEVKALTPEIFEGTDVVIASTPDEVAREFAPWAVERGAVVVDESGAHRMLEAVPLVVPEVNPHAIFDHKGIIASPNCSTTQMVVALKPIHDEARVRRVIVSTYQATSGAGLAGRREMIEATKSALSNESFTPEIFQHPIGFNCIPQIGSGTYEGYTSEEMKMVHETRKIFGDPTIEVCPTCVRVPIANCHCESIVVETERPISVERARELFRSEPGIELVDDLALHAYPMPSSADGRDEVFIGRLRRDISSPNGLAFWCVSDNLRKGAATNAVQIAELLLNKMASC